MHMSNRNTIFGCFECFLGCLRPNLLGSKSAATKNICAECTYTGGICFGGSACIKSTCAGGTYVSHACTWVAFIEHIFAIRASARRTCIGGACIGSICTESTFIRGADAINYLAIYS